MKFNSSAGIEFLSEKSYSPGVIEIAVAGLTLQGQGAFFYSVITVKDFMRCRG
jgi:hypothetical protein